MFAVIVPEVFTYIMQYIYVKYPILDMGSRAKI